MRDKSKTLPVGRDHQALHAWFTADPATAVRSVLVVTKLSKLDMAQGGAWPNTRPWRQLFGRSDLGSYIGCSEARAAYLRLAISISYCPVSNHDLGKPASGAST
jgi:hypothetical protein